MGEKKPKKREVEEKKNREIHTFHAIQHVTKMSNRPYWEKLASSGEWHPKLRVVRGVEKEWGLEGRRGFSNERDDESGLRTQMRDKVFCENKHISHRGWVATHPSISSHLKKRNKVSRNLKKGLN